MAVAHQMSNALELSNAGTRLREQLCSKTRCDVTHETGTNDVEPESVVTVSYSGVTYSGKDVLLMRGEEDEPTFVLVRHFFEENGMQNVVGDKLSVVEKDRMVMGYRVETAETVTKKMTDLLHYHPLAVYDVSGTLFVIPRTDVLKAFRCLQEVSLA